MVAFAIAENRLTQGTVSVTHYPAARRILPWRTLIFVWVPPPTVAGAMGGA